jgi:hypothetical protein
MAGSIRTGNGTGKGEVALYIIINPCHEDVRSRGNTHPRILNLGTALEGDGSTRTGYFQNSRIDDC